MPSPWLDAVDHVRPLVTPVRRLLRTTPPFVRCECGARSGRVLRGGMGVVAPRHGPQHLYDAASRRSTSGASHLQEREAPVWPSGASRWYASQGGKHCHAPPSLS